jgi:glycosyltransferase involved in cell wall biosynthesis
MSRASVLPDTNIWRYLVDADVIEAIRMAARSADVDIVACPAVVYECLRMFDVDLRRRLAKALTRGAWLRPMPEAFVEACEQALASSEEERVRRGEKMRAVLKNTSWDVTAAAMQRLIEEARERRLSSAAGWAAS